MTQKRVNGDQGSRSRRKSSLSAGDVLVDMKGDAYRVVFVDEHQSSADTEGPAALRVRPIEDEVSYEYIGLTRRQRQIARLLANRATNAEIAQSLGISVHTARHHSQRVLEKLGVTSRAHVRTRFIGINREIGTTSDARRKP